MLCNIDQNFIKDARRILTLLCFASRPLTLRELIDGIAVEINEPIGLNKDCRLEGCNDIHDLCPGFININLAEDDLSPTVQIAHFSVQEYLESDRIRHQKAAIFSLSSVTAHAEITQICLVYLLEHDLATPELDQSLLEKYPLAHFAAMYWYHHYQRTVDLASEVDHLILRLFQQKGSFVTWVKLHDMDGDEEKSVNFDRPSAGIAGPVYYLSLLGLDKALYELISIQQLESSEISAVSSTSALELSKLINAQGGFYGDALRAASCGAHEKTVQLLLDSGADLHALDGHAQNALNLASERGHDKIVQLLLDKGADVNAQSEWDSTALKIASSQGHEKTVQLLLDRGADLNAQGRYDGNALHMASSEGHEKTVQLLLDRGADLNAQVGHDGNALQMASYQGHEKTVQLLLDRGADLNAQVGYDGNALQTASSKADEKTVQLLLDRGADVNAQGGFYGNALQAAALAYTDRKEVVQLLLDRGADVNAQGGRYGNALQAASAGGYKEVVQLLLDQGVDVNAQGGFYGNALQAAASAYIDRKEVVQLLPDRGADINAKGGEYGSALLAASFHYHNEVVQLLLAHGATESKEEDTSENEDDSSHSSPRSSSEVTCEDP